NPLKGTLGSFLYLKESFKKKLKAPLGVWGMNYWLVKSEPGTYSWDDFVKEGQTCWSGVRNYAARLHLRNMKKGDEVFFYHSNEGTDIVGIAKVIKEVYQDPTTDDDRWSAVDLKPVRKLKKPVPLETIKKDKRLAKMALVRIGRLSVQPVTDAEYKVIMELAGEK
ncbi:MAG TPA: EVE domain-containing protein, partial [Chitinophagaceae bacterium]|nr:EVE domain-containing protein [Chitinophagaceae bacterium]